MLAAAVVAAIALKGRVKRALFGDPIPGVQRMSSPFGPRVDPITGGHGFHNGVDLPAPRGTPVRAVEAGVIEVVGQDSVNGNWLRLRIQNGAAAGWGAAYCHLSKIDVARGQSVARGEHLGEVGSTGRSTGPHLHFTLRDPAGRAVDAAGSWVEGAS